MDTKQKFLNRVDAFKEQSGLSDFKIGQQAMNDARFIVRLRQGAGLTTSSMDRVDAWIRLVKKEIAK